MWYKNVAGTFFGLVTKHACDRRTDRQTDGQNYESQDRASIAASRGKNWQTVYSVKCTTSSSVCKFSKILLLLAMQLTTYTHVATPMCDLMNDANRDDLK